MITMALSLWSDLTVNNDAHRIRVTDPVTFEVVKNTLYKAAEELSLIHI